MPKKFYYSISRNVTQPTELLNSSMLLINNYRGYEMNEAQKLNLKLNPQQKLISGEIACHIVGFGRTKLNLLVKAKKFPQPIRFSQNFVRWDLEEVNQWIEEQKAARA